jgi:16S rRNA (adenine1518-N6/adenine1519-N6)-dimethyltransferase
MAILRRHGIQPSKGLGQNFLIDRRIQQRIVEVADLDREDIVLEIGPGLGLLTREMAARAGHVVAVELDRRMIEVLQDTFSGVDNVHVIQGDILEIDPPTAIIQALGLSDAEEKGRALGGDHALGPTGRGSLTHDWDYKVVANLPYYITSAVLRHVLNTAPRPQQITVMVQREVAQRIVAQPGDLSLLAIGVQVFGEPRIAFRVPAGAFFPRPKVDSALLQINVYPEPRVPVEQLDAFFTIVRAGFGQKRKQLHNSLAAQLPLTHDVIRDALQQAGIDPRRRAQTLSIEEWLALLNTLPQLGTRGAGL